MAAALQVGAEQTGQPGMGGVCPAPAMEARVQLGRGVGRVSPDKEPGKGVLWEVSFGFGKKGRLLGQGHWGDVQSKGGRNQDVSL